MPAVGSYRRQNTHDLLLPAVPPRPVNHVISLDRYYRSADLVLRQVGTYGCRRTSCKLVLHRTCCNLALSSRLCSLQASEYRAAGNEYQLYVMLMRFAGCALSPAHHGYVFISLARCRAPQMCSCQRRLVIETIPQHKDFPRASAGRKPALPARYREFQKVCLA